MADGTVMASGFSFGERVTSQQRSLDESATSSKEDFNILNVEHEFLPDRVRGPSSAHAAAEATSSILSRGAIYPSLLMHATSGTPTLPPPPNASCHLHPFGKFAGTTF